MHRHSTRRIVNGYTAARVMTSDPTRYIDRDVSFRRQQSLLSSLLFDAVMHTCMSLRGRRRTRCSASMVFRIIRTYVCRRARWSSRRQGNREKTIINKPKPSDWIIVYNRHVCKTNTVFQSQLCSDVNTAIEYNVY